MRYQMKEKLFAWGDDYNIKDESGQDRFFVDGKVFSLGDKLSFQDMSGNELAYIAQKLLSLHQTYEISRNGSVVAVVQKQLFTVLHCKFAIDVSGPDDLEATGEFLDHEYDFVRGGNKVATVSKSWFALTDTYGVDISDGEDDVLILAATVVIDLACHHSRRDSS